MDAIDRLLRQEGAWGEGVGGGGGYTINRLGDEMSSRPTRVWFCTRQLTLNRSSQERPWERGGARMGSEQFWEGRAGAKCAEREKERQKGH